MTNATVGSVYTRVMQEVLESSQVDFEESGIDQQTLEDLKETWQKKLSNLNIASFPWEPAPAAAPIINPPTVPSNGSNQRSSKTSPSPAPSIEAGGARVKNETSNDVKSTISTTQSSGGMNTQAAQQRAASLMQGRFGSQASKQVETLMAQGAPSPAQQQQQQFQQQQQASSINGAQTDGAADPEDQWAAVVTRRNEAGQEEQLGTVYADRMLRRQVEAMAQRREGGGLLLPLAERPKPTTLGKRKVTNPASTSLLPTAFSSSATTGLAPLAGYDGGNDSDEEAKFRTERDEDAINSDLDDPNAPISGDEDEQIQMQNMLCTYDKVQRVKNKWKCTLKDGVLMVNGREYLFHKAQGEFEW